MSRTLIVLMCVACVIALALANDCAVAQPLGKWTRVDDVIDANGISPTFIRITAPDSTHIMALGKFGNSEYIARRSSDGGTSWATVLRDTLSLTGDTNAPVKWAHEFFDLAAPTSNLALIVGDSGSIWRSEDWGNTWSYQQIGAHGALSALSMADSLHGILCEAPRTLWRTDDGGKNWSRVGVLGAPDDNIAHISAFGKGYWMVIRYRLDSDEKYIDRTLDGGILWTAFPTKSCQWIYMLDERFGWTAGIRRLSQSSTLANDVIHRTTDGGATWEKVLDDSISPAFGLTNVMFANPLAGIAIGPVTKVIRTTDGGLTWKGFMEGLTFTEVLSITDIAYPTPSVAFISVARGGVYKYDFSQSSAVPDAEGSAESKQDVYVDRATETVSVHLAAQKRCHVRMSVVDLTGADVVQPYEGYIDADNPVIRFDCRALPQGFYLIRTIVDNTILTSKMCIVR